MSFIRTAFLIAIAFSMNLSSAQSQESEKTVVKAEEPETTTVVGDDAVADDAENIDEAEEEAVPSAEDKGSPLAGHSFHGEVFNEGPRQAAYLMDNTGNVSFPISTDNETVQKFFNQGVGQLHGFWYLEAERSFRQIASIEPECAMAYWGMAMSNTQNKDRAKDFVKKAFDLKDKVTKREKMYIEALHRWYEADEKKSTERAEKYTDDLEKILYEFPDDLEAKAFLGLQQWLNRRYKLKIQSHLAVDALLQQVLQENPLHPCHHYVIHLWDHERAEKALVAAAKCGESAPGIAHMWHMPGHIYSDLQRYEDAVWQQEASARVDHAHMMRDQVLPDQISNFAHNNEWLIRNLIKIGRVEDGLSLARNMIELPQHPKYNNFDKRGSASYGRSRLLDVLNTYEMWDELIAYGETPYLEPTEKESEQIKRNRHLGRAWFRKGDADKGREYLAMLEDALKEKQAEQKKKGDEAAAKVLEEAAKKAEKESAPEEPEPKSADEEGTDEIAETAEACQEGKKTEGDDDQTAKQEAAADEPAKDEKSEKVKDAPAKKEKSKADTKTEKAAKSARKKAEKAFIGQISNIKNAVSEMKGHIALADENYDEALKLLKKGKDFPAEFRAQIELLADKKDDAIKTAEKNVDKKKNEVRPLLSLIETLWQCEKKDEAKEAFEKLRKLSGSIDDGLPLFARLDPIAEELGYEGDWRVEYEIPDDFGPRPELASLGPFRWQPPKANGWVLPDAKSIPRSLSDYEGKPTVVIFYLGHGCLHCVEQLGAFAPKTEEFEAAGLSLIAISSDSQQDLTESIKNYEGGFPFPLVADPSLEVFKDYRVYDDFEQQPLHGTFLIDGNGRIRWHDVSYEPFMDPDFVIKEAKRLLNQNPVAGDEQTASTR
jgi:peroxiredoxin